MLSAAKHLRLNAQKHEIPHTAYGGFGMTWRFLVGLPALLGMTNGLPLHPQWPVMSERKNARLYRAAGSEGEDGNRARTV